ncbi:MAG: hypothetical protein K2L49_07810 [Muribaculaceae bacterium]|nr:hypothetical protein [Muribaculaceae bacterium]
MTHAIIYKEWLKTRLTFLICLAGALAMTIYAVLAMKRTATLEGVDQLWLLMLLKGETFLSSLTYVPLICGTAIGIAQMIPETSSKRLKLTLHLPCGHTRMLITMLATGLAETIAICLVIITGIAIYDYSVMAPELAGHALLTALPWLMAGVAAYLMTSAICLESSWIQRVVLALAGAGIIAVFYMGDSPESHNSIIAVAMLLIASLSLLTIRSAIRFKEGRND